MALSTLRKYKLISGDDLMRDVKTLQDIVDKDDFSSYTDTAEPIFYALCLCRDMVDINAAKKKFNEYKLNHDLEDYNFSTDNLAELIKDAF